MNADNFSLEPSAQALDAEDDDTGRDLVTEGHLRAMGLWNYLSAAALACFAVFVVVEGLQTPRDLVGSLVGAVLLLLAGAGVGALGYFLRDLSDRVRRTFKILGIIGLVLGVIGAFGNVAQALAHDGSVAMVLVPTGLNLGWTLFVLYMIDSPRAVRVCTPEYRTAARAAPGPHGFASPLFWGPFGLFGATILTIAAARAG
jgi:hypothetical protein